MLASSIQAQILRENAELLQGSRSSVVRALTAKVRGLGSDSQWLPMDFSLQYVSILIYHLFLPSVVDNQYSYKNNHACMHEVIEVSVQLHATFHGPIQARVES